MASKVAPDQFLAIIVICVGLLVFIVLFLLVRRSTRHQVFKHHDLLQELGQVSQEERLPRQQSNRVSRRRAVQARYLSQQEPSSLTPPSADMAPMTKGTEISADERPNNDKDLRSDGKCMAHGELPATIGPDVQKGSNMIHEGGIRSDWSSGSTIEDSDDSEDEKDSKEEALLKCKKDDMGD